MAKKRTRAAQKQQLAAKLPLTRDYQPIMVHHWGVRPRDLPLFTFLSVQAMLYDPTIRLGLAMRAAPVYQTEFGHSEEGQWTPGVESKNEAVGEFVYRQLQRIWQHDIGALVKSQLWGHAGGEVLLKLSDDNMIEVDRLLERHPNDIRALKRAGQNVGIRISRLTRAGQGNIDLEWPKGYWTTFNAEAGTFYGTSILLGAYSPWYDKWCDGGALDVRRLYMHKDAYVGASVSYPEGDIYIMPDGSEVPARDLARQMVEQIVAGGVIAMPSDTDERGNRKWELKPATVASNPAHILKYPQDLDTEMLRGLEVPDDIFTADSTSSGAWAGKKVPLSAFYAGIDIWIVQLIKDLCRSIFEPLVLLNFGKAEDFQIAHKPLAQQAMEQQQGGQPQGQPGQPGEQPGGAGGGMGDLFAGMGDMGGEGEPGAEGAEGAEGEEAAGGSPSLADLLSSPAAQQARKGPQAMSLAAAVGRGVLEASAVVQASRAAVDAALRMASDANPWTPYKGPRGGTGWVHGGTQDVRYVKDRPGASETGGEEKAGAARPSTPTPSTPTKTKATNEAHVAAFQQGDNTAAERLLKQNGGLIYNMAKKFAHNYDELEDFQQEARIAMLTAAKAFDPSKGYQFSTLATRSIINRLSNVRTKSTKRKPVWQETQQDEEGRQIEPSVQPDRLPMEGREQQQVILEAVQTLPERTREIVQRRYGLDGEPPETASDIGRRVGLSPQRVSKILDGARDKLRSALSDYSIQLAIRMAVGEIRMAGDVNPWIGFRSRSGKQAWRRTDTGERRYQEKQPGTHEGSPGDAGAAETAKVPETTDELVAALDAVAASPQEHGLDEATAAKLQQAKTATEKVAVLDEATGHKFDQGAESAEGTAPEATEAGAAPAKDVEDAKAAEKAAAKKAAKAKAFEATKHLDDNQLLESLSEMQDPSLYFDTTGATMLPVKELQNIRARPGGIANAMRFMYAAATGVMPKRGPVSVMKTDKGYEIFDGNSTFNIAKQAGWENLPVKFVDASGEPVASTTPDAATPPTAPSFARHELPQLLGADKPEFYSLLHDAGIKTELKSVPVGELKGIQRDLNQEKVSSMAATIREKGTLGPWPLLASNDGYIVDGHHRWAAEKEVDPTRKTPVVQVDLPVRELISKLESFPKSFKAGTDEAPRNWQAGAGQPATAQAPAAQAPVAQQSEAEHPVQPKQFVKFTDQETSLPKDVSHPYKTMEAIYRAAYAAKPTFEEALDHGRGVDKAIGGRTVYPTSEEEFLKSMELDGPVVVIAPVKGEKRAKQKVEQDYGGDWTKLGDMVRATIAVDDVESLEETLHAVREYMGKLGWKMASSPKDRFAKPVPGGYRDVIMKFIAPNGLTSELQLNTKAMILAKEGPNGHKMYVKQRDIEGILKEEGREATPEEQAEIERLIKIQSTAYESAWQQSRRKPGGAE